MAHDGAGVNDQLAYMLFGVNTGAGVIGIVKIDSDGNTCIGDGGVTNYQKISITGVTTLHGSAKRVNSIWIPATGMKGVGAKAAIFVSHGLSGAFQFTDGTDDQVVGSMRIPNRMDRSVAPVIAIGWSAFSQQIQP